jgi:hypothetical protein
MLALRDLTAGEARVVHIGRIRQDPAYQVRGKLDVANIDRLRRAYESGRPVTPITVAIIAGQLNPVLIDGWHRVQALVSLGRDTVEAVVIEATEREARWLAASANLSHGQPLKKAEQRAAFKAFIRARKHIDKRRKGRPMLSYREIAPAIGVSFATIRRWMMKDFPKIASAMGDDEAPLKGRGGLDDREIVPPNAAERRFAEATSAIREAFKAVNDPDTRGRLIEDFEATLRALKDMGDWNAPDF